MTFPILRNMVLYGPLRSEYGRWLTKKTARMVQDAQYKLNIALVRHDQHFLKLMFLFNL